MISQPQTTTAPDYVLADVLEEQLQAAITAAEVQRDAYVVEANRQLAYHNGRIDALRSLLPAPAAPELPPEDLPDAEPS